MKKKLIAIIIFVILSVVFVFWAMAMTASEPDNLKFHLIYIPLLIFLILQYYFIFKIKISSKRSILLKVTSFCILPILLMSFLFFSFGEATNKICVSGDCDNGYGEALYIKSERTSKSANASNDGEFQYYKPEFLGRNWFNNIVWYDGNPITYIYKGEFKNGFFHGKGEYFWFTYDYEENHKYDDSYKFIDGIYLVAGEWERGWLHWDRESRVNGHIAMNDEISIMLHDYGLDKKDFFPKVQSTEETQKGKLLTTISTELPISCIKLSPNKNFIAVADDTEDPLGFRDLNETYKINILNSENYSKKFELTGHNESIESINFSTDSKKIISSDKSGVIIIWNLSDGKQLVKIETNEWVHNIKFSNSGNEIIAIQGYEKVALIYSTEGDLITKLEVSKQINDFEFNPTTNEIYFGCYDEFQVWSLTTREKINSSPFSGLMCIKFNHDYSKLAVGNSNGDIILMTPELKEIYRLKGHFKPVLSISFSFDNSKLASASSDQTSRIWDLKKQSEIVQLTNEHKGTVEAIEFISPQNVFMTGGENKELKVWK